MSTIPSQEPVGRLSYGEDTKSPEFQEATVDAEAAESAFPVYVKTHDIFDGEEDAVDPVYQAKARILNAAFQEIGMGKYQWWLFFVGGFGWFTDNAWPCITGLIINPVTLEFVGFKGPFLILAQSIGLLVGAVFWGVGCDIWGRRWSFNLTLIITAIFAISAGGAPTPIALCALIATWNIGVGGNLPVDSAVFLEFVPASHQWLLTVLSIWWAVGQLVASLVAWPFIANFSCPPGSACTRAENMGWRYFLWTMGALMVVLFVLRFFVFEMYESPRYLVGRGRDAEAVEVVHKVARFNGKKSSLTVEMFAAVDGVTSVTKGEKARQLDTSVRGALARKLSVVDTSHVKALFVTRKMAYSTSLLIVLWAFIGLAFPLYNGFVTVFLQTRGADFGDGSLYITYRNQVILSVMGIPGALLAGWMVERRYLGRKGTLAVSTALTGVFLFASTTARTSDALLGWNCGYTFTNNVMYGTLYAVSPEIFPAKDRGTGNALVAASNRVFGIMAPIIALYADLSTPIPIYVSGALFIVSGLIALLLPFEPRGRASV
ncbi:MFS general substrate transporter [Lentinus tigrinus ALCF2SS1-7]|uniref:MFS general substrate transporter n=1 Tax=Lentinus tigrinus ALCF2SS1-6 TaxID=1328759 RepID=A0A5C2SFS4_9APHY|nr:MFS general substrate transporter [Lentinus tigrinus ALCF2SS1-6]RPD77620.1 MFS general substrate transporter [Lentinus tigrinus ALCF2SS1-7]